MMGQDPAIKTLCTYNTGILHTMDLTVYVTYQSLPYTIMYHFSSKTLQNHKNMQFYTSAVFAKTFIIIS
jgi:hypothetical protein